MGYAMVGGGFFGDGNKKPRGYKSIAPGYSLS